MMKGVTFFKNFNIVIGQGDLKGVFVQIRRGDFAKTVQSLRQMLATGDTVGYNIAKKALLAFTAVATFDGGRKNEYTTGYSHVNVLDVDKLQPDELVRVKKIAISCPYTLGCFISPSGNGLKIFVSVVSGLEDHLNCYLSLQVFFQNLLDVEIDSSGKDITRLCFVSDDPEAYYNENALDYDWKKENNVENVGRPLVGLLNRNEDSLSDCPGDPQGASLHLPHDPINSRPAPKIPAAPKGIKNIMKIFFKCLAFVEKYKHFIEGERNVFVYQLALQLRLKGIPETTALSLIQVDHNYEPLEVVNTVRSAYNHDLTHDLPLKSKRPVVDTSAEKALKTLAPQPIPSKDPKIVNGIVLQPKKKHGTQKKGNEKVLKVHPIPTLEELDRLLIANKVYQEFMVAMENANEKPKYRIPYNHKVIEVMILCLFDLRYNLVKGEVNWRMYGSDDNYQKFTDHTENSIIRLLHNHGQYIPMSALHHLIFSNFSADFHPFKEYFNKLRWNGKRDYIGELCRTVQTTDDVNFEIDFKKWFVAYAAGLFEDEVINHTIMVFIGAQGIGKSSWFQKLVPNALKSYLCPGVIYSDHKDTQIQMSECCLIILDELESLNRRDLGLFKDLVARMLFNLRRPYGRSTDILIRHASFIASVNHDQVLTDTSGSRRYLCFTVKDVDYQHNVDIDGCMAQAKSLYNSGFQFWFDKVEIADLNIRNEDYVSHNIEEEMIRTWLRPVTMEEWQNKDKHMSDNNIRLMTASDIAIFLTTKARMTLQNSTTTMVGRVLRKLKFIRIRKHTGGYLYLVRVLKDEEVERNNRTLDDTEDKGPDGPDDDPFGPDYFKGKGDINPELPF